MALTGDFENEILEEGKPAEEVYLAKFTNGTLVQLKELAEFLKKQGLSEKGDPIDVVRLGISFLVSAKEDKDKEETK